MSLRGFREYSKWLSQVSAAISIIVVVFLRSKFTFEFGNTAGMLVLVAMITSLLTLIFGVAAVPRWQGFVALVIFVLVAYYIFFEQLYGLV
ncbi:MAG: hypothetical protein ACREBG_09625 [Pyrinomonadaceae bacterium]